MMYDWLRLFKTHPQNVVLGGILLSGETCAMVNTWPETGFCFKKKEKGGKEADWRISNVDYMCHCCQKIGRCLY